MITWHLDPSVMLGLLLLTGAYAAGVIAPRRSPHLLIKIAIRLAISLKAKAAPFHAERSLEAFGQNARISDAT